jgi:hypothetical protein
VAQAGLKYASILTEASCLKLIHTFLSVILGLSVLRAVSPADPAVQTLVEDNMNVSADTLFHVLVARRTPSERQVNGHNPRNQA